MRLAVWPVAASVLLVVGFGAGRLAGPRERAASPDNLAGQILRAIDSEARSNTRLADLENSPFTFTNVSFRPAGEGGVEMEFDFTTHLRVVEPPGSDLTREVFAHSLTGPTSAGGRLSVLSHTPREADARVREALIFAMRRDETLAVRMRALTILANGPPQPGIEEAILETLQDDEAVSMRLLALDYLAARPIDRGRLSDVITSSPRPGKEALHVRLAGRKETF